MSRALKLASLCLLLACAGCKASPPGKLERAVAGQVKLRLTVGGKKTPNPLPATAESIREGRAAFSHYCIVCHGLDGQNTGVPFAEAMSPPVPSLSSPDVQRYTDGQLKWIITNGISPSGMPASRGILNDEEMWKITYYLRHLPAKGSLGEPGIYAGDPERHPTDHRENQVRKPENGRAKRPNQPGS